MTNLSVVSVQMDMAWQDIEANYAKARALLAASSIAPGSLIVFPEMFATGFSMNLSVTAQDSSRASEALLRELAAEYDCAVMGGVVGPVSDGMATNEAAVFSPAGQELVRYVKQKPFSMSGEDKKYRAGSQFATFQWQGVTVSPFICYDLRFPELFRLPVAAGAELIVVIACWPAVRSEHWVRLLQARAIENLAAVVGVNRSGAEPNLKFDGRSTAFDQQGVQLFEAAAEEQVVTANIDVAAVREWRESFPALRDMQL